MSTTDLKDDAERSPTVTRQPGGLQSGIARVLAALGAGLDSTTDRNLPAIFEREVRQLVDARDIRLREVPARYQARLVTPTRSNDAIVLGVPTPDNRTQAVLEASLPPNRSFRDDDMELLAAAAQLGGLVLEAARVHASAPKLRHPGRSTTMLGSSPVIGALRQQIGRVATTDFTVLMEGESGTGKELVARQVHEMSRRRHGPFVAVNCAAVVETLLEAELFGIEERTATGVRGRRGKFEQADGGTLFLDEVSDLSPSAQAKLLRAIQDVAVERVGGSGMRRVNTRIVVATNRPLADMVRAGAVPARSLFRLGGVEIHVPPLRERRDDVIELAQHFLARHRTLRPPLTLSTEAQRKRCVAYKWPGNVRELERLIERAVALAETESDRAGRTCRRRPCAGITPRCLRPSLERARLAANVGQPVCADSSSIGAAATSGAPAGCSTSATTRCKPICWRPAATLTGRT